MAPAILRACISVAVVYPSLGPTSTTAGTFLATGTFAEDKGLMNTVHSVSSRLQDPMVEMRTSLEPGITGTRRDYTRWQYGGPNGRHG